MMTFLNEKDLKRFESKINYNGKQTRFVSTPCHEWTSYVDKFGYGSFGLKMDGKWKVMLVHRIAKMHYHGWRPEPNKKLHDQCCRHLCNNPSCCNPDHIEIGNMKENNADKKIAGTEYDCRGANNSNASITEAKAQKIKFACFGKKDWKFGDVKRMAENFNVSIRIVDQIKGGYTWKHLPKYPPIFEDEV